MQVCIRCYAKQTMAKVHRPDEGRGPVPSFPNHSKMQCASFHFPCYAKQSMAKGRRPDEGRGPVLSFRNHLKMH